MQAVVSVIVPVYNVAPYILRCLKSIAAQNYRPIECLLIDDCGTDNSISLTEQFISEYKGDIRFSIIRHQQNLGLSGARNTGMKAAKGDYIYFLDSDDAITPDCSATLVSLAEKYPDADYIQGHLAIGADNLNEGTIDADVPEYCHERKSLEDFILCKTHRTAWNRLMKRSFLLDNDLFFPVGLVMEDHYWNYFVAKQAKAAVFCRKATYYYFKNDESIINNPSKVAFINRYSSYIALSKTIISDLLQRDDTRSCHSQYVGEAIVFCMVNLARLQSIRHWCIFWHFAFRTAWQLKAHITGRRSLLFLSMMPPCCFFTNIKAWRWRLRQYIIAKL